MTNCSKDMQVNLTIEDAGEGYIKSFKLILVKPSFSTKLKQGLITISGVEMIAEVIILVWTLELGLYSCSEYGHLHVTITPFPAELIKLTLASYNTHHLFVLMLPRAPMLTWRAEVGLSQGHMIQNDKQ